MKRLSKIPLLLSLPILVVFSQAQVPASQSATQNIVTVSFNAAVLHTAEAQKELSALQTKFAPRQAQLKALNDEVESMRKQMDNAGDKPNETERSMREQSLDSKEKQLQRQVEDFKNDSQTESQQVFQRLAQKVYAFLQTYSQQHGYTAVIERGSDDAPIVWYAVSSMDITDQLVKAYDAQGGLATPRSPDRPNDSSPIKPPRALPESPSLHQ